MRFLLHTRVLLWAVEGDDRLSRKSASLIADLANEVWFSPVSVREVAIKRRRDRPDLRADAEVCCATSLRNAASRNS